MKRNFSGDKTYGFNASYTGCKTCVGKLKLQIFSENCKGYLKNHWSNTRLVCTHLNAFFMLNPYMVRKIWINIFFFFWTSEIQPFICSQHQAWREFMLYRLTTDLFLENLKFETIFLKIQGAVSRTTAPILGLFVLI